MSERQKSQKGFVAVTLITLLAIAAVLVVYASLLGTWRGGEVTVGKIQGNVYYSINNVTDKTVWKTNLYNVSGSWYAKFNTTDASGYSGPAQITWQLQNKTGPGSSDSDYTDWNGKIEVKSVTLTGGAQDIYSATDWGFTPGGSYRLKVTLESTG